MREFDPDAVLEFSTGTIEFMRAILSEDFSLPPAKLDKSRVLVYREKDFLEIIDELKTAADFIKRFAEFVVEPDVPGADPIRRQLLAEPQIQTELRKARARNHNEQ